MLEEEQILTREEYLNSIIAFKDKDLIKVITGIRRCGKSTLFDLYIDYLKKNNIAEDQIIKINFEDPDFDFLDDYKKLYEYIKKRLISDKKNYVFLDEVQKVPGFERACDGLYIKKNVDLYITGSNAHMLSGELATLLSGRYVEIKMLPFSFGEYCQIKLLFLENIEYVLIDGKKFTSETLKNYASNDELYSDYITKSSFPQAAKLTTNREIKQFLDSICDTIYVKDIMTRKKIADINLLKIVTKFVLENIGNITSANNISKTLTADGRKISNHTVESYLTALTEAFLFYKCERYDVKGKNVLKTGEKYYATDVAMRFNMLGKKNVDQGHILENIVYLELLRRGYSVYIGKVGENEIDFVAIGEFGEEYYQVAYTAKESSTLERELKSLDMIRDHNPKYLLTTDREMITSHNGIIKINVFDWLLD